MIKTIFLSQAVLLMTVLAFSQSLSAGLIDDELGQPETEAAKQFETDLPAWLKKNLTDTTTPLPQMTLQVSKKETKRVQFVSAKDGVFTWEEVARVGWIKDYRRDSYKPYWGKKHTTKFKEFTAKYLAELIDLRFHRDQKFNLRAACWMYSKGKKLEANNLLGRIAEKEVGLRPKIEEWICEKHGWKPPENGLIAKPTFDFETLIHGQYLITQEAFDGLKKVREKAAKDLFKKLQEDVGSTKGKPGLRKGAPKVRLEILNEQLAAFEALYGDLPLITKKSNNTKLADMRLKVSDDLKYIAEQMLVCDRLDIDAKDITNDFTKPAKAWAQLLLVDPNNPTLVMKTAYSHQHAAGITQQPDGRLKPKEPAFATSCSRHYEQLIRMFPSFLSYRVSAGYVYSSQTGGEKLAKQYFKFVIERVDAMKAPDDRATEAKKNAEAQLKKLK
ncbi:hypothetical protein OAU50_03665 [Planctomycetota bacterium]|nr:hypothetical protein [Planctomycetota bacterium]